MSEQPSEPARRPELTALESALRDLAPAPVGLDRDAVMFRAGQAAAPRRWLWPAVTAVSSAAAVVLAVLLACRPAEVVRYVPAPPSAAPANEEPTPEPNSSGPLPARVPGALLTYRQLEQNLLRQGLDGLGEAPPSPDSAPPFPLSSGEILP
jgi:hypothetical protein